MQPFLYFCSCCKTTVSTDRFKPPQLFLFTRSAVSESKREDPCRRVGVFQASSFRPPFSSPPVPFPSLPLPSFFTLLAKYLSSGYKFKGSALFKGGFLILWLKKRENAQKETLWQTTCLAANNTKEWKLKEQISYHLLFFLKYWYHFCTKATHFLHTLKMVNSYHNSHLQIPYNKGSRSPWNVTTENKSEHGTNHTTRVLSNSSVDTETEKPPLSDKIAVSQSIFDVKYTEFWTNHIAL